MKGTIEKALQINLNPKIYGTIAEIGAGQEVARNFFVAGAAAGTIAKTMSAYDMQFSDAIYGKEDNGRYVSYSRVNKMIEREYKLVVDRLEEYRPEDTMFFAFADTVAAKGYKSDRECHGWLGIKFQVAPNASANKIILHVRLKENSNVLQQKTLGVLGINLIHSAFYHHAEPSQIIDLLLDGLSTEQIEVDMIEFIGDAFNDIDNRLMSLHLVRSGLTHSVFFTHEGHPVQGSDLLYHKNILSLRGSFRPFSVVHSDILNCGRDAFKQANAFKDDDIIILPELSMSHLLAFGNLDKTDFLGRVDTLCKMGFPVQISDFAKFHEVKSHLHNFTKGQVAMVLGIKNLVEVFDEENYTELLGGRLEGLSLLISRNANLYVYPKLLKDKSVRKADEMNFEEDTMYLYKHFITNKRIVSLDNYNPSIIDVFTRDIREKMHQKDLSWKNDVPENVSNIIVRQKLFGYED